MKALTPYSTEIESSIRQFYNSLSEKDKRAYAAVEAQKLGYGGVSYISRLLGCDVKTIEHGHQDLAHPPELPVGRTRRAGGGRKKK